MQRPDTCVFVADRGGRILGCLVGTVTSAPPGLLPERCGTVLELAIDSHGRGNGGIGTHLLEAFVGWLRPQGVTIIESRVPASHAIAQAFWRGFGAKVVADVMRFRLKE
jgi:GNAT superfamily N-acetyltransferase